MYGKGVVAVMLIAASLSAQNKSTETVESLFEGTSRSGSSVSNFSFSDSETMFLECFFEEFPDTAEAFHKLPPEKQDEVLDALGDLIEPFLSMLPELLDDVENADNQVDLAGGSA